MGACAGTEKSLPNEKLTAEPTATKKKQTD